MIKICFLLTQVINSGPENVALDICSHIDQSKYRPIIFSLKKADEHRSIEDKFSDLGIEIVHFDFSKIRNGGCVEVLFEHSDCVGMGKI